MGGSQGPTHEDPSHEQLAERLRLLDVQQKGPLYMPRTKTLFDEDFVLVEEKDSGLKNGEILEGRLEMSRQLSPTVVIQWQKELLKDSKNRLAMSAFTANDPKTIITSRAAEIADTQTFNLSIPLEGSPVTNQRSSGRCWLFASTNVFRIALIKRYDLKNFELSQSYLFFWDKLEKANYFLENILETIHEPLEGRILRTLLSSPVSDGGQWDMVANLVKKYGLVPQNLYPDSFNAMNSATMDALITSKLRENALRLREQARSNECSSLEETKNEMLREIHLILTLMLGPPPAATEEFTWEFYTRHGKFQRLSSTPLAFAQELSSPGTIKLCAGTDVNQLFSLVHDPRNQYSTLLSVNRLGNVWGGLPVRYVNVDMPTLKKACITMLKRGLPVFFGSDVGKFSDRARGILDTALYDYELGFNLRLGLSKQERLMTGESAMTHAMVLTAVHIEDDRDVRWRVENSWSDDAGDRGYFVMSSAWMDEWVYQAVVDPSCVPSSLHDILRKTPTILPLWDPMGSLA